MTIYQRIKDLAHRAYASEFLRYLVAGGLTTAVNFVVLSLLIGLFGIEYQHQFNLVAIFAAILFAYLINRAFVFRSQNEAGTEIIRFFASRIMISLLLDSLPFYVFSELLHWEGVIQIGVFVLPLAKIVAQVAVVLGNYVAGKFFVFVSKKN